MNMPNLLVVFTETDEESPYYGKHMVSHGINTETDQVVVLQDEPLDYYIRYMKATWDDNYNGWVID